MKIDCLLRTRYQGGCLHKCPAYLLRILLSECSIVHQHPGDTGGAYGVADEQQRELIVAVSKRRSLISHEWLDDLEVFGFIRQYMRLASVSVHLVVIAVGLPLMLAQTLPCVVVPLAFGADLAPGAAGAGLGGDREALIVGILLFLRENTVVVLCLFAKRQLVVGGVHLQQGVMEEGELTVGGDGILLYIIGIIY